MKENIQQSIIRVLAEFKFGLINKDVFVSELEHFYKEKLQYEMNIYATGGWREKIIFTFFALAYNKKEYLSKIENEVFFNINGKELKCYLLVITIMSINETKKEIFEKLISTPNIFDFQKEWIYAASRISKCFKISYVKDENIDKCESKFLEAITIINSIRMVNNIELINI